MTLAVLLGGLAFVGAPKGGPGGPLKPATRASRPGARNLPPQTGITACLAAGGALANAQAMAADESPHTTRLYDPTGE
jgi:hypothetical protein